MRILWHSAAPWQPTGYGVQTALMTRWLRDQGHDVAISAYTGILHQVTTWEGIPVLPPGLQGEAVQHDLMPEHARQWKADLVIILYDLWHFSLGPEHLPECPVAFWVPADCAPLDRREVAWLRASGALPVAMSEFGRTQLEAAGFAPAYVPHAVDTTVFAPVTDTQHRAEIRKAFGIPEGGFAVGMNGTTTDGVRKAHFEQMAAFAAFQRKHPEAVLLMHTLPAFPGGENVAAIAADLGIAVSWPPPYNYLTGTITANSMASWYNALDVLANCSYGEGFGLAMIEAQACGTPVIATRGSTGPQLVGPGWLVKGQDWWNPEHRARWTVPFIHEIGRAYGQALLDAKNRRAKSWAFAGRYSMARVGPMWDAVLEAVTP